MAVDAEGTRATPPAGDDLAADLTGDPLAPLACGRDAARVWDRAEAGETPDVHERGCPHCLAARADAGRLDAAVHRMADAPVAPPASALRSVMRAVRTELRPEEALLLEPPSSPSLPSPLPNRLARSAAATVLRAVVDTMDGLRARSCRIDQPGPGFAGDVALTVTARFGVELASATARVRQMVLAASEQALGLPLRRVDIEVVDLWEEP